MLEGYDKASEETEFSYKNCCNDDTGIICVLFIFQSYLQKNICKGLSSVNSSKFEPKTCSKRYCFYSENLFQSIWISSQVNFIVKLRLRSFSGFLRLSQALSGSLWLSLALSGSLWLSLALSAQSGSLRLLLCSFDFNSGPGANTKFGLPPPPTEKLFLGFK